ncbi:MAG: b(o/a)3-type cytochrome-c oxidase subunit 1 [Methylohalobius crimeensis]
MTDPHTRQLSIWNFGVAFSAFLIAAFMGFYQVVERSGIFPALESAKVYFASVSSHGVLMAYVLTTFFIMGFGYYTAATALQRPIWKPTLAWSGFGLSLFGTVLAAIPLLTGKASVLYTFYPPIQASSLFYIGVALLVAGSWIWCVIMIVMTRQWQKENPGRPIPLAMFGTAANVFLWLWTSAGVGMEVLFQLIPWSLGWSDTVDPGLARTLFVWTLHPIVYFWLIPAYIAMYCFVPRAAGGYLFSDEMARFAFLGLLVFSLPIGFHHLYVDPEQAAGWKLLHGILTFMVAVPTLITGFTVLASLEIASRLNGGRGLLGWIGRLAWGNPMVLAAVLALLMLILGGFGGIVNASYALNTMVHNTAWVPGHFHLIFAGTTVIMYFAIAYHLWPRLTGKALCNNNLALIQLWTWFVGMTLLSTPWHVLGLLGQPRRISSVTYHSLLTLAWQPYELFMIMGGALLLGSAVLFGYILLKSLRNPSPQVDLEPNYADPIHPPRDMPAWVENMRIWNVIVAGFMLVSFGIPILQFFFLKTYDSVPWGY